jgi:hypothetical protein
VDVGCIEGGDVDTMKVVYARMPSGVVASAQFELEDRLISITKTPAT